jgi:hypothetical protein
MSSTTLYVVSVISNPASYERRYSLFKEFCKHMETFPSVKLITVELQQGERPFQTESTIKLRTKHEVWFKENLINIAINRLPSDWKYVAWIDADLIFQNKSWADQTIERLQTYDVVQLFSHAIDMSVDGSVLQVHTGFMFQYVNGEKWNPGYERFWHPGYAWACTREAYDAFGGLIDFAVLGSADHHMALGLIGMIRKSLNEKLHSSYIRMCTIWEERCERHLKRNCGYVPGTIMHNFHGCKSQRQYTTRWNILINNQYDPMRDVKYSCEGLLQLEDIKPKLRDDIRRYFRTRNEDGVDIFQDYQFMKQKWV